ncbi:MAG TPA: hypothetical protein VI248_22755 [Kineosporiaceae bacterium]
MKFMDRIVDAYQGAPEIQVVLDNLSSWFGIITRQSIRCGNFASLTQLIREIEGYIARWNESAAPFEGRASADEILDKVTILERGYWKLLANNTK